MIFKKNWKFSEKTVKGTNQNYLQSLFGEEIIHYRDFRMPLHQLNKWATELKRQLPQGFLNSLGVAQTNGKHIVE